MINTLDGHSIFPPEFVSPKAKESKQYGLEYANAVYNSTNRYGGRYFYGSNDFDALVELSQGRQSVDNIRRLFGYHNPNPNSPTNDGSAQLAQIDIQVLNLAPKYVNRAVAKMQKLNYDVGLQAIDIVSNDEKATFLSAIQTFYRINSWAQRMSIDIQTLLPDIDTSSLPQNQDELLYDLTTNPKIKKEISGEMTLKLIQSINRFTQKMREVDWDMVVIGRGHLYCYNDENGIPRVRRINPKFWIGSYVENDDFEDQEYSGFFDFITINQFIKETSQELTPEEQMDVVRAHSSTTPNNSYFSDYRRLQNYDGLGYIPVMRFYFRSEDNRTFVKRKNQFGSKIIMEKEFNYIPPPQSADRYSDTGDSKIITNTYTSIYGGTWVVDSNCIYNYGRQKYPRTKLVNATLPIKTFATNFKEGRSVSFASQMIEPLYMINTNWNKIKEILAQGYMGVMEIDFNQIENIAIGQGGKLWTALDVVDFFLKKKILIKRGRTNQYDQNVGEGITLNNSGLTLADYWTTLKESINLLEQMTGTSVIESSNVPDRLTAKGAELGQMTADIDMEYLYNAHEYLFQRASHQLLLLAQESRGRGKSIKDFIPALGKVNSGYYDVPEEIAYCEYGMYLTRQPGPQEWAEFYADVSLAVKAGTEGSPSGITLADSALLREMDNLKQARQILAIRQKIYKDEANKIMAQNQQSQNDMNAQSAQDKMQMEIAKIKAKLEADKELLALEGQIKAKQSEQDSYYTRMNLQIESQVKTQVSEQEGRSEIVKQALRNIPEKQKVAQKEDEALMFAEVAHRAEDNKAEAIKKKPVPTTSKKK